MTLPARFLLCDDDGTWLPALRQAFGPGDETVWPTPDWPTCRDELKRRPASLVAFVLRPENVEVVFEALRELPSRFPASRGLVLAARTLAEFDLPLREAGAIHVVFSPRCPTDVVRLVRRHLASAPRPVLSLAETLRQKLPWGDAT